MKFKLNTKEESFIIYRNTYYWKITTSRGGFYQMVESGNSETLKQYHPHMLFAFIALGYAVLSSIFLFIYPPSGTVLGCIGIFLSIGALTTSKESKKDFHNGFVYFTSANRI